MRDYIRVWTTILYDADPAPTGPTRASFWKMSKGQPADVQPWIDLYSAVGGYTDPQVQLNEPRWYGWNADALIVDLNAAYFINANYDLFIRGSQTLYAPRSGQLDIFIASPRKSGFNSISEEPRKKRRKSA
jgi:hypothetical protein